ncbi:MAG TPA: prepilin-type N-terminal cleavage/methylation domain-containing protein [Nitrospira sp.]|jgi:general secretion pathway protein G|nr:prepilin-type N-terminal cleavage/methylation domain-containing protein [Nitrospira sp.]HEV2172928.1 prepilin-type N-terminal cleavage/methylation domain-containing protein [Nitrospira sp.]
MEHDIAIGEFRLQEAKGFTLIELLIVVSIIGILATLAAPSYQASVVKAREAALRQDLFTLRDVLDQHRADQGKYPPSLQSLVSAGYLRAIPKDPFTNSDTSWQEMTDATEGGVFDVFSGSEFVGTNGTPYNRW